MNYPGQSERLGENDTSHRIFLYDNLKFLAILMVVVGHTIDPLALVDSGNHLEKSLFLLIYSVHMPLFIFMSGLFLKPMDKQTPFPKKRVISFIVTGMIIRAGNAVLNIFLGEDIDYGVLDVYDTYAWYMWAMAIFIALIWLFRDYGTTEVLGFALLAAFMSGFDKTLGDELALSRILVFFPFFVIGYMVSPSTVAKVSSLKPLKLVSALAVILIVIWFLFDKNIYEYLRPMITGRNSYYSLDSDVNAGPLIRAIAYTVALVFGFSLVCLVPNKNLGFVTRTGTKTLQIYFWHKFFINTAEHFKVYEKISALTGETVATVIYILLAVLLTFLCSAKLFSFPTKQIFGSSHSKNKNRNSAARR